jgi:26S proteasome regulatory subunit N8
MGIDVQATKVIVHPLVLLSVVDHFNRMGKIGNQKRVVGVLLGCWKAKGILDISNSFAGEFQSSNAQNSNFCH